MPVVYVGVGLTGISPQDSERLLLKPIEEEIRAIEGIDKLQGFAFENYAAVIVKFDAADSMKLSIDKVRDAVNDAKVNFPEDAKDPVVSEVSVTDEPNIIISIDSESASERYILNLARQIKKDLELIPSIFEVEIEGARDEQLEAVINRDQLEGQTGDLLKKKIPLKRFATVDELDTIISMLLNKSNTYMTGAVVAVDGGLSTGL